jgi:hypothetical protein
MKKKHKNRDKYKFWQYLKDQIIQMVPDEIAICEFDCRREHCLMDNWKTCANRKKYLLASNQLPDKDGPN